MTRNEAKEYIRANAASYLTLDNSGKGHICPLCGSGTGKNGTGMTTEDGIHFTCWACGQIRSADIFDIIGKVENLTAFPKQLERAAEIYSVQLDDDKKSLSKSSSWNNIEAERHTGKSKSCKSSRSKSASAWESEADYTAFYREAASNIGNTDYHRGISLETLGRFGIGFVERWTNPKAPKAPPSPRLIIPTSSSSYLARDTRSDLTDEQKNHSKSKVGKVHIFNAEALNQVDKSVIIVEGEIDALSIIDVGGEAVGLGGTSNIPKLLDLLKDNPPAKPLIVALDNDGAGNKAGDKLCDGLKKQKIPFFSLRISEDYKDANDVLQADRNALEEWVELAENYELEMLKQESAVFAIGDFVTAAEYETDCYPTGFDNLDRALDGGFYPGLYILGAISSLGKTTFCQQISDQIAENGNDVMYFSLEMEQIELIAKSLSRETFKGNLKGGLTTREVLRRDKYTTYPQEKQDSIEKAIERYRGYAENIYIIEGVGDVTTKVIRKKVEEHIRITHKRPVVIVDYLQIISPLEPRATDKQNTDKAVLELKRLSRDFGIPVIGISSFNRENYYSTVSYSSFKESGGIEYSSDVLIGMQFAGMDKNSGSREDINKLVAENTERAKNGEAQRMQVKIIKNRNGVKGDVGFDFYPKFNLFVPSRTDDDEMTEYHKPKGWKR